MGKSEARLLTREDVEKLRDYLVYDMGFDDLLDELFKEEQDSVQPPRDQLG